MPKRSITSDTVPLNNTIYSDQLLIVGTISIYYIELSIGYRRPGNLDGGVDTAHYKIEPFITRQ